jgi:hypothetical protein
LRKSCAGNGSHITGMAAHAKAAAAILVIGNISVRV